MWLPFYLSIFTWWIGDRRLILQFLIHVLWSKCFPTSSFPFFLENFILPFFSLHPEFTWNWFFYAERQGLNFIYLRSPRFIYWAIPFFLPIISLSCSSGFHICADPFRPLSIVPEVCWSVHVLTTHWLHCQGLIVLFSRRISPYSSHLFRLWGKFWSKKFKLLWSSFRILMRH